jgi:HAMP domain-containing protein
MEPAVKTSAPPADGAAAFGPDLPDGRRVRRRVRNYLLDTGLQLRLASYLVAVSIALSLGLGGLLWRAYRETSRVVELSDPEVGAALAALLAQEDRWRIVVVGAALVLVLICLLGAAVVVTHRIAGPAYAIRRTCRRVAEGDLAEPPPLRARDLLVELGDEVAEMVRALREREAREAAILRSAAEALRDRASSGDARAALAATADGLAAEKERRLSP